MAEAPTSTAPVKQLFAADSPLVWVDCEMTGLVPGKDKLLEIAVKTPLPQTFSLLKIFRSLSRMETLNAWMMELV